MPARTPKQSSAEQPTTTPHHNRNHPTPPIKVYRQHRRTPDRQHSQAVRPEGSRRGREAARTTSRQATQRAPVPVQMVETMRRIGAALRAP
eukprot:scaffold14098_cov129-Isochrysis_galbana.AAC.2